MQRDTELALKDIHRTPDALLADLARICAPAAVTTIDPAGPKALDLRFLTFDNTNLDDINPLLYLTEKGRHVGETNYVAVSYTWQKFTDVDNQWNSGSWFQISTGDSVRNARSQDALLRRAIRFARSKDARFLWVDKDCIDQDDPDDIERHLHVVHNIFNRSRHAIGLLSFHIFHQTQANLIKYVHQGSCQKDLEQLLQGPTVDRTKVSRNTGRICRLLAAISADAWFTRTWTFMERLSAPHMLLLLPCEPGLASTDRMIQSSPLTELELGLKSLQTLWTKLDAMTRHSEINDDSPRTRSLSCVDMCRPHDIFCRLRDLLSSKFMSEFGHPPWTHQRLPLSRVTAIFHLIERHNNTVLSDRLLVLGYLCGFPKRVDTRSLNHCRWSYSTCLLALVVLNGYVIATKLEGGGRRSSSQGDSTTTMTGSFLWNSTLSEILACASASGRRDGELSGGHGESFLGWEDVGQEFLEKVRDTVVRQTSRL